MNREATVEELKVQSTVLMNKAVNNQKEIKKSIGKLIIKLLDKYYKWI